MRITQWGIDANNSNKTAASAFGETVPCFIAEVEEDKYTETRKLRDSTSLFVIQFNSMQIASGNARRMRGFSIADRGYYWESAFLTCSASYFV